ncbi:MAG TPA: NAD(P)/FAD-dependent oxidoreductase [Anaeromyxobacteraceae bacterium]|nr:NAD(P)/FAD-dependent oxidoreductase [Anaeromyxobacteraceae bacterium]
MPSYDYLIVGGGMTAHAAASGIREIDPDGTIGMIADEPQPPYARPPLSKALWKGEPVEKIWLALVAGLSLHTSRRAVALDRAARRVRDDHGIEYQYQKLLLATGGSPRVLPFGGEHVVYFRTLADYQRLRSLPAGRRVAVIGGGFIGAEMAAALAGLGHQVTMLFPEEGIGARLFPRELFQFLNGYYREKGVEVHAGAQVLGIEPDSTGMRVRFGGGEIRADAVVAGIGIRPNTSLAEEAGLKVEDGIVVDSALRTSDDRIFAAGDVARFWNPALDRAIRVEHEDNANTMGREAGRAMAGALVDYRHLPFYYSDLFDLGYEAVGELDARHEMVIHWMNPYREGFVYYLASGRVRGALSWGIFGQMDAARELIAERGPFRRENLIGRLPR